MECNYRNSAQYSPTQVQVSDDAAIQGSMVSSEQADHSEANETSLNQSQPAVKSEE